MAFIAQFKGQYPVHTSPTSNHIQPRAYASPQPSPIALVVKHLLRKHGAMEQGSAKCVSGILNFSNFIIVPIWAVYGAFNEVPASPAQMGQNSLMTEIVAMKI